MNKGIKDRDLLGVGLERSSNSCRKTKAEGKSWCGHPDCGPCFDDLAALREIKMWADAVPGPWPDRHRYAAIVAARIRQMEGKE